MGRKVKLVRTKLGQATNRIKKPQDQNKFLQNSVRSHYSPPFSAQITYSSRSLKTKQFHRGSNEEEAKLRLSAIPKSNWGIIRKCTHIFRTQLELESL